MKRRRPTIGQATWPSSEEFRQISRRAVSTWNAKRVEQPRCGATRKSDGESCRQWPMQNGRCYLHGGLTPCGDQWHRPQYSSTLHKLARKLRDRERQAKKRAAKLAAMSSDERAAYDAWQATHRPGPPGARAAARVRKRQAAEAREILAGAKGLRALRKPRAAPKAVAAGQRTEESTSDDRKAVTRLLKDGVFE